MSLFRAPREQPLAEYDAAIAGRLTRLLIQTMQTELATPETDARRLASEVVWTVTREGDGVWLNLNHAAGSSLGVGGNWRRDEAGLTLYVRQMAYSLLGRESDFEP